MPHACQLIMSLNVFIFNIIGIKTCIYIVIFYIYIWEVFLIPKLLEIVKALAYY